jgi:hypothetical protein
MFGTDIDSYATQSALVALQLQGALKVSWIIQHDLYRIASELLCVVFCYGLYDLAAKYHAAKVTGGDGPKQYPPGYFVMFTVQLVPLIITGFVRDDAYIIGTRLGTFFMVLLCYALVHSRDGTFSSLRQRIWVTFWFGVAIVGPTVWLREAPMRHFVEDWQTYIAWSTIAAMLAFVVLGEHVTAKELFRHYLKGNYSFRRFSVLFVRFGAFAFQAIHYFVVFGWHDPIFWQGVIGALGAFWAIAWAVSGIIANQLRHRTTTA